MDWLTPIHQSSPEVSGLKKEKEKKNTQVNLDIFFLFFFLFVIPEGFEPSTYCLEGSCSIQLSYGTILNKPLHFILLGSQDYFHDPVWFCCKLKQSFNLNKSLHFFMKINFTKKTTRFILSGWQDSNLRPPAPKAGAITGLRYTPKIKKRRVRDSNPWYSSPYACLANMSFRPLRQLSKFQ